ncbi:hypothetical protein Y1Q_0019022 [Alligator mississippiensis]|uniref:Uncharacterized protein n=1 Tax=Alligator mississippiensis TaxID=8496 RepID=A0A151M3R8_ALLMI|nr:hypothetical protein Y1Q_0019022 [Alligator mississippiensis]
MSWKTRHTSWMAFMAKLVGVVAVTAKGNQLHDDDGHMLLQSEGWLHANILAQDVKLHLVDDIHEGGPAHAEYLKPLFSIPGAQDDWLSPIGASFMGPEPVFDGLVEPEHPSLHGILDGLDGLILVGHTKASGPVQDT